VIAGAARITQSCRLSRTERLAMFCCIWPVPSVIFRGVRREGIAAFSASCHLGIRDVGMLAKRVRDVARTATAGSVGARIHGLGARDGGA
jgi:hypothetical protein